MVLYSACADRSGLAASKLLERYLFFSNVLRFWLPFAGHCWQSALELLQRGCDLNAFLVKGGSDAEKNWLAGATVSGVAA